MPHVDTVEFSSPFKPEEAMPVKSPNWDEHPLEQKIDETCEALAQFGRRTDKRIDRSFCWIGLATGALCHWFFFVFNFPTSLLPGLEIIHMLVVVGIGAYLVRQAKTLYQQMQIHQVQRVLRLSLMKPKSNNTADTSTHSLKPCPGIVYDIGTAKETSRSAHSPENLLDFAWDNVLHNDTSSLRTYSTNATG